MNNPVINPAESDVQQSLISEAAIRVVTFKVGNLNLALRVEAIYKILNYTAVHGSGLNEVGIAHVEDREVIVVDLQRRLFETNAINSSSQRRYLIITESKNKELFGIPVTVVPSLLDIPLSVIRVLPETYRQADTLGIASHVAVMPTSEGTLTLFMLDVDRLLATS